MTLDELLIDTAVAAEATTDPSDVITAAFVKLTRAQRDELARDWFADTVHSIIRARTRDAERRAVRPAAFSQAQPKSKPQIKHGSIDKRRGGVTLGCTCDACEQSRAIEAEFTAKQATMLSSILNDYKAQLRIEWTAELLSSTFGVGDGTLVTWGEATADQHRDRLEMFKSNAIANIEGAARHEAALDTLTSTGAPCLNLAVQARAA